MSGTKITSKCRRRGGDLVAHLMKISALAEATGVSRNTAIKWVRDGVVPGRKIGDSWFVYDHALEELLTSK